MHVAQRQRFKRLAGGRGDGGENAEQRVRIMRSVAFDQRRIVEIIACIEPHALRQPGAESDFMRFVEQRNFDTVHFRGVFANEAEHEIRGRVHILLIPNSLSAPDQTCRRANAG